MSSSIIAKNEPSTGYEMSIKDYFGKMVKPTLTMAQRFVIFIEYFTISSRKKIVINFIHQLC